VSMGGWEFNRVTFSGEGGPAETVFLLEDDRIRLNLYNVDFAGGNVTAQGASVLGLVNCQFGELASRRVGEPASDPPTHSSLITHHSLPRPASYPNTTSTCASLTT